MTGPVIEAEPSAPLAAAGLAAVAGLLHGSLGPSARLAKNLGATWGNIAYVNVSSGLPSCPFSAFAAASSASHSGLSRSAGRSEMGPFLACFSASSTTFGSRSPIASP